MTSPTYLERARTFFIEHYIDMVDGEDEELAALMETARNDGLEEAAKVCADAEREYLNGEKALKAAGHASLVTSNCAEAIRICVEEIRTLKTESL